MMKPARMLLAALAATALIAPTAQAMPARDVGATLTVAQRTTPAREAKQRVDRHATTVIVMRIGQRAV